MYGKLLTPENRAAPPELLAPAGSFACALAAFEHGADAVYAGIGRFNLRAHSPNFTVDGFCELVDFANDAGKKVYGVLNIMPDDLMLDSIEDTLLNLKRCFKDGHRPHALIISDPGVLSLINDIFNSGNVLHNIPIHLSTQNGCFNSKSMQFWKNHGVTRVILPRELNIGQIKNMTSRGIIDTEIFIHGAMCVSISGRCLMGAYYNRRHPNLGDCPQPCRFKYKITPDCVGGVEPPDSPVQDGDNPENTGFYAEESENGVYLLNSKDLCTISILPALIETGAVSFKIEGRNKSAHYVASVVKVYRDAIDTYLSAPREFHVKDWWASELEAIEHRPYTTGFYDGDPIKQELFASKAQAGYRLVGTVKAMVGGSPVIDVKNSFAVQRLNVLPVTAGRSPFDLEFAAIREFDDDRAPTPRARPNRLVTLDGCSEKLRIGDMLRVSV